MKTFIKGGFSNRIIKMLIHVSVTSCGTVWLSTAHRKKHAVFEYVVMYQLYCQYECDYFINWQMFLLSCVGLMKYLFMMVYSGLHVLCMHLLFVCLMHVLLCNVLCVHIFCYNVWFGKLVDSAKKVSLDTSMLIYP